MRSDFSKHSGIFTGKFPPPHCNAVFTMEIKDGALKCQDELYTVKFFTCCYMDTETTFKRRVTEGRVLSSRGWGHSITRGR